ncbi:hypothetical protein AgCh_006715 [Apium graveolens]
MRTSAPEAKKKEQEQEVVLSRPSSSATTTVVVANGDPPFRKAYGKEMSEESLWIFFIGAYESDKRKGAISDDMEIREEPRSRKLERLAFAPFP